MQPLIFLQNGEQGISRGRCRYQAISGKFGICGAGPCLCDFQIEWKYDCKYQRFQGSY